MIVGQLMEHVGDGSDQTASPPAQLTGKHTHIYMHMWHSSAFVYIHVRMYNMYTMRERHTCIHMYIH